MASRDGYCPSDFDRHLHLLKSNGIECSIFSQQGGYQGGTVEYVHVLRHALGEQAKWGYAVKDRNVLEKRRVEQMAARSEQPMGRRSE
ncbi:hypothetical protein EMIT0215P_90152 [Pseudomonas serboccidentalis]